MATDSIEIASYTIKIYALGAYQDPLKKLILQKNYHNHIGSYQLGQIMADRFRLDVDMIIPVPSHWTRTAWRGFNHTEIMAQEIAEVWKIPLKPLLKRCKKTRMQSTLAVAERSKNIAGSIQIISASDIENKNIVVIDDLMTTGSTIKECLKVLVKCNPKSISILVACRTV